MSTRTLGHRSYPELMAALHFTEEDLDANRRGYMTEAQRGNLVHKVFEPMKPLPKLAVQVALLVILATPVAVVFQAVKDPAFAKSGDASLGGLFFLALLSFAIMMLMIVTQFAPGAVYRWWKTRLDLSRNSVAMINGQIHSHVRQRGVLKGIKYEFHEVEINGIRFPITASQWEALIDYENDALRIYYLPISRIILSAERMSQ